MGRGGPFGLRGEPGGDRPLLPASYTRDSSPVVCRCLQDTFSRYYDRIIEQIDMNKTSFQLTVSGVASDEYRLLDSYFGTLVFACMSDLKFVLNKQIKGYSLLKQH